MARLTSTLAARIALFMLAAHAVLLPVLFYGLTHVVERGLADQFIAQVRGFSRVVADDFELGDALDSAERARALLDSAILRGDGVYAELRGGGLDIRSTLGATGIPSPKRQDFDVGQGGDDVYFLMLPLDRGGRQAELWLGFDEKPMRALVSDVRRRILMALGTYLLLTMALSVMVALWLTRPLTELRQRSRRVASGDYAMTLGAHTSLREVVELGEDLERMRGGLVGIGERLRREIEAKAAVEAERRTLEEQLRRKHRLETVGTLAGGVAHEFNNALVPIMLYAESLLLDTPPERPEHEQLMVILSAARRAREIVRKVLTFSRTFDAAGLEPLRLEALAEETARLFAALVPPNIRVERAYAAGTPLVLGDAGSVSQLVMNLSTNAYQAMQASGGVLTIGTACVEGAAEPSDTERVPLVELFVRDTGHGMDTETLERIFEPFFTTREVGAGTGLGLAVAHGIATNLGATILVESAPGRGTTFRVRFRAAPADDRGRAPVTRPDAERSVG
jgi:signal transduction histidine kinase